jgi:Peptidase family M28
MRKFYLLFCIIASTALHAQKVANPKPFASLITEDDLKKHLYIVASKEFEGRETATAGQRIAAAYIQNHFKSIGLAPGNGNDYQLYYPVFQDSLISAELSVNDQPFNLNEDFSVNVGADYSETLLASEVVFVGHGASDSLRDDYKDLNVSGKIALVVNDDAAPQQRSAGRRFNPYRVQEAAQKHGAIAILVLMKNFSGRTVGNKGNMYLAEYKKSTYPNTFFISEKVAKVILGNDFANIENLQPKTYQANMKLKLNKQVNHLQSSDVLGYLEGTDLKDQLLVISAHYDHLGKRDSVIYYGADDDGSGTVSILEIAQAFSKAKAAGKGPRRSILFLANSGEEKGLWGSAYYTDHPTYSLDKTTVDLNIDMIGRIDPNRKIGDSTNYVYVVGDDKLSSDLKPISESANKKYTKLELDYKFNDPNDPERIYYRSDHFNFARKGVPIIFYFDGIHHDYHRPTDTPDKINYDILAKRARLVFYTAWDMANRNDMLKRDIPLK